ncbi:DUF4258 domain-containing protein [Candidatus Aerophobetes bacterium]|nr:DUF4258 domain-containing protein [Candidatus Aerophobetes bacterium]
MKQKKNIIFHPHALRKMRERDLSTQKVREILKGPQSIVQGKWGRKIAQKIYGEYLIRVVFEEQENHILVVTAYPAKPEKYLEE